MYFKIVLLKVKRKFNCKNIYHLMKPNAEISSFTVPYRLFELFVLFVFFFLYKLERLLISLIDRYEETYK